MLYADKVTESMRKAILETERRRALQKRYNDEHGLTPESVRRSVKEGIEREAAAHEQVSRAAGVNSEEIITLDYLDELEKEMLQAADELDFERAAQLRDRIEAMREKVGQQTTVFQFDLEEKKKRGRRGRRGGDSNRARIPKPER